MFVDIQIAGDITDAPPNRAIESWVACVLRHHPNANADAICVRIVGEEEITILNTRFRDQREATNVLSFTYERPPGLPKEGPDAATLLGDIVICAPVVEREAESRSIDSLGHWAHMVIHGTLHLLGYDHQSDADAAVMESLEIELLAQFSIANPYEEQQSFSL